MRCVEIRRLTPEDLPDLMTLKSSAGWNQTEEDWLRWFRLEPEGCFGIEADGRIAATAATVRYGQDLAWIGMVLTLPDYRGRGFARRLMEAAVDYAGSRPTRLDASDMGLPLYASMGFETECRIERWRRESGPVPEPTPVEAFRFDGALDRAAFGADRTALLRDLCRHEGASKGRAYALGRPGSEAAFFGPCVSESAEAAEALLRWFTARHLDEAIMLDVFPEHEHLPGIARALGFEPFRRLTRMVRGGPVSRPDPRIYAIAGFEWG